MPKELKVEASDNIKNKIRVGTQKNSNDFKWVIGYTIPLNADTVNNNTVRIFDEDAFTLKCDISYVKSKKAIVVRPLERYADNKYYYLYISNGVKGEKAALADGGATIRFLLKNNTIVDATITSGRVIGSASNIDNTQHANYSTQTFNYSNEILHYRNFLDYRWVKYAFIIIWPIAVIVFAFFIGFDLFGIIGCTIGAIIGFFILLSAYLRIKASYIKANMQIALFNKGVDFFNSAYYNEAFGVFSELSRAGFYCQHELQLSQNYI